MKKPTNKPTIELTELTSDQLRTASGGLWSYANIAPFLLEPKQRMDGVTDPGKSLPGMGPGRHGPIFI